MPGYLATMNVTVTCMHGGPAKPSAANPRVKINGTPVPAASAPFTVMGCAFNMGIAGPKPCLMATYDPASLSRRVKSMGQGLIVASSTTQPAIVTPPAPPLQLMPIANPGQTRVRAQ